MTQVASTATSRGWYHGWNIVAACILSQVAVNGLTYNAFSLFVRDWSTDLHTDVSQLQLAFVAVALWSVVASPVVGSLADKFPARRLFAAGLIIIAIFYLAMSVITEAWQFFALYGVLVPVGFGLATAIPANALIARWFVRRIGLALGLTSFGLVLAGVLLPPIIGALLPTVSWRMIWRVGGLLVGFVVMPLVVLVLRDRPTERDGMHYLTGDGRAPASAHGHAAGSSNLTWRDIAKRKNFWLLVAAYIPIIALQGAFQNNLGPYAESHGLSPQSAGVLLSALSFSALAATLGLGLLSDRFGNRLPFAGLAVAVAAGAAVLSFASGLPAIVVGCVLVGFGGGLFTLVGAAIAAEFGAGGVGRAFGLALAFIPLTALAPFAIAKGQELTGSYAPALMGMAALVLIGGALILMLRERRGGHLTSTEKEAVLEEAAVSPII